MPIFPPDNPIRKKVTQLPDVPAESWLGQALQTLSPNIYRTGRRALEGQYDNPLEALTDLGPMEQYSPDLFPGGVPLAGVARWWHPRHRNPLMSRGMRGASELAPAIETNIMDKGKEAAYLRLLWDPALGEYFTDMIWSNPKMRGQGMAGDLLEQATNELGYFPKPEAILPNKGAKNFWGSRGWRSGFNQGKLEE